MKINDEYDIEKALKAIEDELISSMMRNFDRHRAEEIEMGFNWTAWQAEQLKALELYKRGNIKKYKGLFGQINQGIENLIRLARETGGASQEIGILNAIKKGFKISRRPKSATKITGDFFKVNDRKLNALVKATISDMEKAEQAVLRRANDQYRKIIFNAQVYANTGAGTYEKAVDMAAKDFLQAGINCIEYKNGSRHKISDYAKMAVKTANKRAYLIGEGEKRAEWGIHTVIVNKRGNACPLCMPFVGKILIDDVYSGGSRKDGSYPLLSAAMSAGFLHPNCKDIFTTYFPGISTPPGEQKLTREDLEKAKEGYSNEQEQKYCQNNAERYRRMSANSLDGENKRKYGEREREWRAKEKVYRKNGTYFGNNIEKDIHNDIIKESFRKSSGIRDNLKFISDDMFEKLTIRARKKGAVIVRGTTEVEQHLDKMGAAASNIGDVILFRKDVSISEVLEETYHFEQNLIKMNDDKGEPLRTILNEIDAKRYLLNNAKKYNIPRNEIDLTQKQLESYEKQLENIKAKR